MRLQRLALLVALASAPLVARAQGGPPTHAAPAISLRADGMLTVDAPPADTVVRYTLDGNDPTKDAGEWLAPVDAPAGYAVKARLFTTEGTGVGWTVTWAAPAGTRKPSTLVPLTQNRDWRSYDWSARHEAIVSLMRERQPEVVMLGDSITHFWGGDPASGRRTGAEVWDRLFAGRRVVNLGYGWDRTENVLWRLTHGEFEGVTPKVVVVMIGTNNMGLNTVDEIAQGVEAICAELHRRSSSTRILLLGIFPRGAKPDATRAKVSAVNERLARLDGRDGITFLDIGARFLGADGSISQDVMYDYLHPTARGYALWAEAMGPTLERLLK